MEKKEYDQKCRFVKSCACYRREKNDENNERKNFWQQNDSITTDSSAIIMI